MLSNTSRLASNDIGIADVVEQRRLTMVYVSHHSNNGRAWHKIGLVVGLFGNGFRHFRTHVFSLEAELFGNKVDGFGIQTLVDRHHNAHAHQRSDNLVYRDIHHRSQFAYGNKLG